MKKKIKPMVVGLCLGGLLLTGCEKEEGSNKTTTEQTKAQILLPQRIQKR